MKVEFFQTDNQLLHSQNQVIIAPEFKAKLSLKSRRLEYQLHSHGVSRVFKTAHIHTKVEFFQTVDQLLLSQNQDSTAPEFNPLFELSQI